ncbi:hypothetical protein ACFYYB_04475 [Streptomyces sp. NPDC002886]|uniref:hypothetical protein n=1 Tax=Streptomyces sp. NPDC002886 TaxID=3364667 RepID=UPI0036CD52E9
MTDELRGLLRESAEAHLPDRARILARVGRGTAPRPRNRERVRVRVRALTWPKIALATLATAGTLTVSALMVVTTPHAPDPPRNPTAAAPSSVARPAAPVEGSRTENGPLWADGSVDPHSNTYWAQSNVTLKAREPLTSLVVELRIALTEGVRDTGSWRTRPAADFDLSARQEGGFLVYRWTLKPGRSVPSGEHVFAGQYDHAPGGRDAKDDTYRIDATAGAGAGAGAGAADGGASVWGGFA